MRSCDARKEHITCMGLKATAFLEDELEELGRTRHGLVIKYNSQIPPSKNDTGVLVSGKGTWGRRFQAVLPLLYPAPLWISPSKCYICLTWIWVEKALESPGRLASHQHKDCSCFGFCHHPCLGQPLWNSGGMGIILCERCRWNN